MDMRLGLGGFLSASFCAGGFCGVCPLVASSMSVGGVITPGVRELMSVK